MLERNTLIESRWASERWIAEIEEILAEEKVHVAQLKTNYDNLKIEYDNLRAQSQSEIQDLSNSLNQLNLQMSTAKASAMKEYKTSAEFANIIDDEFLKVLQRWKKWWKVIIPTLTIAF